MGTSLAAAHIAGAMGVMKSYLRQNFKKESPVHLLTDALLKGTTPFHKATANQYGPEIVHVPNSH
ncbi:hypothetical protein L3i20_v216000 [Paenibacillus sp. L3-i20]|nr:hypothetical protein L3i20_v216000 [Paenibacillus sp. L3-i20]